MWATLHAFEHNNLDGMTLIPAPKYGQTLLGHGRETSISDHLVEEWRPKDLAGFRRFGLSVFITGPELGYNNASSLSAASACICGNTRE